MDSQPLAARSALQEAAKYWSDFVAQCIAQRLSSDRFQDFVQLVHAKHPLPSLLVADFFLRPQPSNHVSLDPRIPPYIQVLTQLGYIDAPSILRVLYKYSALRVYDKPPAEHQGDTTKEKDDEEEAQDKTVRWQDSYWAEEVLMFQVIRTMAEGIPFTGSKAGLELITIACKWMDLFIQVSATFAADLLTNKHDRQRDSEMETVRGVLVPLVWRVSQNHELLGLISKPSAKGEKR